MLIDHHCHLDYPDLERHRDEVLARAKEAGVGRMVTISTIIANYDTYRAIAEAHAEVYFTVGTHPHHAHNELDVSVAEIVRLSGHPKCIGVGEAGLDYFYDKSPRDAQREGFLKHIAAARESGLPLVIHSRDADEDTAAILEEEMRRGPFSAVLHCFTGGADLARRAVAIGLYVSFSGVITFKKNDALRAIAAEVPMDRVLVETDAPFLAPEPFRGKRNEPSYVVHTAAVLARIKGVTPSEIASITTANAHRLYAKMPLALTASAAGKSAKA